MFMKKVALAVVVTLVFAMAAVAADVTGAWNAKYEGRQGRTMDMTFNLKASGQNLTGTVSGMGGDTQITDGVINGDNISFKVKREFQGRSMVMKYDGQVSGDEIKFKQTMEGGDRPPREFTAKRVQ
jgi:opacity protein-like surface antigen